MQWGLFVFSPEAIKICILYFLILKQSLNKDYFNAAVKRYQPNYHLLTQL